tara:strand:- start:4131 stop:4625 length:495 start_codon:yes stop_codon:yes gene_type:complete
MNKKTAALFKLREKNIYNNSKNNFKDINVTLSKKNAFAMSACFAREQLTFISSFRKFPLMEYFVQDPHRWNILNYIIYFSAKKEPIYLEKLKKYIKKSDRHVENILKDCLATGIFIVLDPHETVLNNKKIINIRPSEKLIKEFYGHNILKYRKYMNIIKRFKFE